MSSLRPQPNKGIPTRYVWYLGTCWIYSGEKDRMGWVSLVSLRDTSLGINADPTKIRNCTIEEIDALEYFTLKEKLNVKPNQKCS